MEKSICNTVYIVHFITGEYSDRSERVDAVFSSEQKAKDYMAERYARLNDLGLNGSGESGADDRNLHNHETRYNEEVLMEFGGIDYTGGWYVIDGPHEVDG
jgi:hypothetical protein